MRPTKTEADETDKWVEAYIFCIRRDGCFRNVPADTEVMYRPAEVQSISYSKPFRDRMMRMQVMMIRNAVQMIAG